MELRLLAAALPLLLIPACVPAEPPPATSVPSVDTCGANPHQNLIGQPAAVLQMMKFAQPLRIVRPGMAVTMDYLENRLNIAIGENGRIERVYCG